MIVTIFFSSLIFANQAPSAPENLNAIAVSANEIRISWDPSTDDKRVKHYDVTLDGVQLARTRNTNYTSIGLTPETVYEFQVVASDGFLSSSISSFTISTLASGISNDSPASKPGKGGKGGKGGNNNPPAEEPPAEEPPTEEPPTEEPPTEEPLSNWAPTGWQLVFNDSFDGTGDLDVGSTASNWRFESMDDGLHRAGNSGIDALGNLLLDGGSVRGKRWSGWYNGYNTVNAYREDGSLVLGGYQSSETDPTRPINYVDDGVSTRYGDSKLYTAWIDTFSRKWVGPGSEHVMDPASPGKIFKYGYIESRINFSQMMTPGFRLSMWLMPASNDADGQDLVVSSAYDDDGNNGVEIDLFEYEWISPDLDSLLQLAVLGGSAGSTHTAFDTTSLGIDLHEGYHTIGFLWQADKMVWTFDGHIVKEVFDADLIPDVYSYLIVSREMNSGVKNPEIDNVDDTDVLEQWPYIPRDPGLYAKNIWEFRDRINTDRAFIDYVRIWQP